MTQSDQLPNDASVLNTSENILTWNYWFGVVDTRWLGIFRILFGLLLLKDALYHLPLARIFYSDAGIIPRDALFDGLVRDPRFSLMDALGQPWLVILFFCVWIVVLICLIIGYRVRLMTILNFVLILSVHERNGYILTGADTLMRAMSFWLMFAPVGQYYAVDAVRRRWHHFRQTDNISDLRVATAPRTSFALPMRMLQLQLVMVYCSTSYLKTIGEVWQRGETMHYITQIDTFILPVGVWMRSLSPDMLRAISYMSLYIEIAIPILLLLPFVWRWSRLLAFILAIMLHGGIAVTMSIQDFSILMLICYLPFFDSQWLVWLDKKLRRVTQPMSLSMPQAPWQPSMMALSLTTADDLAVSDSPPIAPIAWRDVSSKMAFNRLWDWLLIIAPLRAILKRFAKNTVQHYQHKPVDKRSHAWQLSARLQKQLMALILLPLFILVIMWNIDESLGYREEGFAYPRPIEGVWQDARSVVWYTGLWQFWDLFAPLPVQYDGWLVVEGQFENGISYDLFTEQAADYETPTRWYWGPDMRWEKYEENAYQGQYTALLRGWGRYYCDTLNPDRVEGTRLATITITMVLRDFHPPNGFPNPYRRDQIWFHWCYAEYAPQS